jgi:hypothetical protein
MCHNTTGDGKGETAKDMKLSIADFTDPATLKGRTDGEIFYIIENGHEDMPPEGQRVEVEENWDLVNYIRSLAKKKPEAEEKAQSRMGGMDTLVRQVRDVETCPSGRFLVDPDHIPARVAESGSNLRSIPADRLHDLAAIRHDQVHGSGHAVDHDVDQQPRL